MQQSDGLGDQQERRVADFYWFCGLFDGEGNISLIKGHNRQDRLLFQFQAAARIVTSSQVVGDEIARIMQAYDIAFHRGQRPPTIGSKVCTYFSINGMRRVKRFIDAFGHGLREKCQEANLMRTFIEHRLAVGNREPYGEKEIDIYTQLRVLHGYRLRESPETTRENLLRQIRYSPTSARKAERAAEMTVPAS